MKCPRCGNHIEVTIGAKLQTRGCKILTSVTTIVTVQCGKCNATFQVPVSSSARGQVGAG